MGRPVLRSQISTETVVPGARSGAQVWRGSAPCATGQYPADLWSGEHWHPACPGGCWHELAVHLCKEHCPFLASCRSEADRAPAQWRGMVVGGHYYAPRVKGVLQVLQPGEPCWCPECG